MTNKEKKSSQKPWINNAILIKIKHRNELFRKKKDDPNNRHLRQTYNKFRNSVNRDIKKSKEKYYLRYFENCKSNMKKLGKESMSLFVLIPDHQQSIKSITTMVWLMTPN